MLVQNMYHIPTFFSISFLIIISLITNDDIDEIDRMIIFLIICKNNNFAIYHYLLFETPFYFILNNIYNKISKLNSTKLDKKIRKELKFQGKIIGLTGNAFAEDLNTFMNAGCSAVYVKPINIKNIKEILNYVQH